MMLFYLVFQENHFQAILATGSNTDINQVQTFVIFLYGKLEFAGNGVQVRTQ